MIEPLGPQTKAASITGEASCCLLSHRKTMIYRDIYGYMVGKNYIARGISIPAPSISPEK